MPVSILCSPESHLNKTNSVYTNKVGRQLLQLNSLCLTIFLGTEFKECFQLGYIFIMGCYQELHFPLSSPSAEDMLLFGIMGLLRRQVKHSGCAAPHGPLLLQPSPLAFKMFSKQSVYREFALLSFFPLRCHWQLLVSSQSASQQFSISFLQLHFTEEQGMNVLPMLSPESSALCPIQLSK